MFIKKSVNDIIDHALEVVMENTPINNMHAGGVARALVESFANELGSNPDKVNLYDLAETILNNGYLSKAKNEYLELIGELFSFPRRYTEVWDATVGMFVQEAIDDETYRYEISKRVETVASSNEESLRLAILATPGVQDIIGREYAYGTGSFLFVVIPLYGFDEETVKADVEAAVGRVKAFGNKPGIIFPVTVPLDITIQLIYHESASSIDKSQIQFAAQETIMNYFGNFNRGQGFVYNDLVQEVMNIDKKIVDFKIISFYLNNEPALLTNQTLLEDERIRPGTIEVI